MKRKLSIFAATSLALSLVMTVPLTTSATPSQTDLVETQAYSKFVTKLVTLPGIVIPSNTYIYREGNWVGTLTRTSYQNDGTNTLAYYSGTVTCSSNCTLPTSIAETE
ncbi:hypothetical protein DCE79_18170 [Lysinibacillus sp. 2017]|uniref:hypothetical protein n=1 Tax=unclassified Lysinibacillus TaxID=2636778 RepID=UPI000D5280DF|nr:MULTISPECIES: hypothetical protein [unclassified Lysinibacillus]AWE09144.1 hypothetical protein DCE79_18170 [Lysinibacillus sp. 2017]TGN35969.1 hypothetical protein E4L99_07435 [Lysinibacillus sp. S2017]